jgi:hypothetical protein
MDLLLFLPIQSCQFVLALLNEILPKWINKQDAQHLNYVSYSTYTFQLPNQFDLNIYFGCSNKSLMILSPLKEESKMASG